MPVRIGTGSSAVDPSALRVAGVAPSKIMLGTGTSAVEVWTAVITVTPQAPTFLAASPWYTLPTQQGVTYSVSGTPGYSQTVTVTATAQAGYELVGQASWTHTYGPPPRYIASGSGGSAGTLSNGAWATLSTHTVASAGTAGGDWNVVWLAYGANVTHQLRVLRNGTVIAQTSRSGGSGYHSPAPLEATIPDVTFNAGDSITFQARADVTNSTYRQVSSWSWSLS